MEAQRGVALVVLSKIQGKLMIDFLPFLGPDGQLHIGFPPSDAIERNLVNDGEQVMTATVYTEQEADGISFMADGAVRMDITMYELADRAEAFMGQ